MYFFSNPVFSSAELQGLIINTDYINRDNNQYSPPVTPAYVHVTSFGDAMNPLNSGKDVDSSERTWSVSSAVASKVMTVTIPEGGRPGTVLTVATPDGTVVNVSLCI